jgi:predicted ATPase
MVQAGKADEGVKLLRGAVTTLRAERHHLPVTVCLRAIAEGLLQLGDLGEARSVISEAVDIVKARGAAFDLPELLRVKAEVLLSEAQPDLAEARHLLSEAIACAKAQSALSWELRASTTLARLRIGQGRIEEARILLASVYGRFTDGLHTKDLDAARALLDDLSSRRQESMPSSS